MRYSPTDGAGSPDFGDDRDSYLSNMVSSRARVTRFIASILVIALSVQIVGAQGTSCVQMSASQEAAAHQEMHHSGFIDVKAGAGASHSQTHGVPACSQSILCMNAPAMVNLTLNAVRVAHIAAWIAYSPGALEPRALCPDSPPPKI